MAPVRAEATFAARMSTGTEAGKNLPKSVGFGTYTGQNVVLLRAPTCDLRVSPNSAEIFIWPGKCVKRNLRQFKLTASFKRAKLGSLA
jgi:hypothetical protein